MLILVGVTINLVANGGLFETARTASKDTEQKKILEELIAMAEFNNDGKIEVEKLQNSAKAKYGADKVTLNSNKLTVNGKRDNYEYKVTDTEISIWAEETPEDSSYGILETYILGKEKNGRSLFELYNIDEGKFIDDESTTEDESSIIFVANGPVGEFVKLYIKYNEKFYKISVNASTFQTEALEEMQRPSSEEFGKTVKFANQKWIILYENENNIEMISENTLGNLKLGYEDSNIKNDDLTDINGDGEITNIEKSIYSYNNAIDSLNKECEKAVLNLEEVEKIEDSLVISVRSVGSNPNNKDSEATDYFTSDEINEIYNNKLKNYDNNWQSDFERLAMLGALKSDVNYWGASRIIKKYENGFLFGILSFYIDWEQGFLDIISIGQGNPDPANENEGIRPIVKVDSSKLKTGTDTDYVLE